MRVGGLYSTRKAGRTYLVLDKRELPGPAIFVMLVTQPPIEPPYLRKWVERVQRGRIEGQNGPAFWCSENDPTEYSPYDGERIA